MWHCPSQKCLTPKRCVSQPSTRRQQDSKMWSFHATNYNNDITESDKSVLVLGRLQGQSGVSQSVSWNVLVSHTACPVSCLSAFLAQHIRNHLMSVVPRIEVKVRLSHISWLVELLISSSGGSGETENLYVPSSQALNQGAPWQQWSSTPIDEQLGLGAASTPSHGACTTSTVDTRSWPLSDTAPLATNYLGMRVTSPMISSLTSSLPNWAMKICRWKKPIIISLIGKITTIELLYQEPMNVEPLS